MRKYENVDIIAALGAVVELNTEHYKSDFKYDIEMLKDAARNPDSDNDHLLWLSRNSGTECLNMDDLLLDKFITVFFTLLPDFNLSPDEVKARIMREGNIDFLKDIDERCTALIETVELLTMQEKGDANGYI